MVSVRALDPLGKVDNLPPQSIADTSIVASHCCNEDYIAWGFLTRLSKRLQKPRAIAKAACSVYIYIYIYICRAQLGTVLSIHPGNVGIQKLVPLVWFGEWGYRRGRGGGERERERVCVCV